MPLPCSISSAVGFRLMDVGWDHFFSSSFVVVVVDGGTGGGGEGEGDAEDMNTLLSACNSSRML